MGRSPATYFWGDLTQSCSTEENTSYKGDGEMILKEKKEKLQAQLSEAEAECSKAGEALDRAKATRDRIWQSIRELEQEEANIYATKSLVVKNNWESYEYYWEGKRIEPNFPKIEVTYPDGMKQVCDIRWEHRSVPYSDMGHNYNADRVEGFYVVMIGGKSIILKLEPDEKELIITPVWG